MFSDCTLKMRIWGRDYRTLLEVEMLIMLCPENFSVFSTYFSFSIPAAVFKELYFIM